MRTTYITATVIAAALLIWLFSGQLATNGPVRHASLAQQQALEDARDKDREPTRVRGHIIQASPQTREVVLRGRSENKRTVEVRAETSGRVVARPVDRGSRVEAGDLLCQLAMEDRQAALQQAEDAVDQFRLEYQGTLELQKKGFTSETNIAQAKARLTAAEADLARRRLDVERTYVRAPFAGLVEDVHQEVGDYVASSAACVTLIDLDPMLLVGRVAEKDVHRIDPGVTVTGILSAGRRVQGPVTFIGRQSDPATRTYAVEVEIPNPDYAYRSGLTAEIRVPGETVAAQKVSPALFALDDAGNIGVRTVDDADRVEFHNVRIVREEPDGVWVTGLPPVTTLITVGQELVVAGERVRVSYEPSGPLPAAAGDAPAKKDGKPAGAAVAPATAAGKLPAGNSPRDDLATDKLSAAAHSAAASGPAAAQGA